MAENRKSPFTIDMALAEKIHRNTAEAAAVGGIAFVALAQTGAVADDVAAQFPNQFPLWHAGLCGFKAGLIVQDEGGLYRSIHNINNAAQNTKPSQTPAMWTPVAHPAQAWPAWRQPTGAHNAYQMGDRVEHGGKHWQSTANGNVWQPGTAGWEEVV